MVQPRAVLVRVGVVFLVGFDRAEKVNDLRDTAERLEDGVGKACRAFVC